MNIVRQVWRSKRVRLSAALLVLMALMAVGGRWFLRQTASSPTSGLIRAYVTNPAQRAALTTDLKAPCPGAPFLLPSAGFVGFLYADPTGPYTQINPHPGIDIFGNGELGTVPIYAAYDGYLTRLLDWKGAVIIRIPQDPLDPSRQIWTYYTHMATITGEESFISAEFPPGTTEKFVKQGTLLGYQGVYVRTNMPPIAMHVHMSVVRSHDDGSFRDETRFGNTFDPSPYFGLTLNASGSPTIPVQCAKP